MARQKRPLMRFLKSWPRWGSWSKGRNVFWLHAGKENPECAKVSNFGHKWYFNALNSFLTTLKVSKYVLGSSDNFLTEKKIKKEKFEQIWPIWASEYNLQGIAQKAEFWRISSKLKKCQNAHPTRSQITFYGHLWFWKSPLVSQDKSRSNGKLGPSIFWTHQGQAWRSHISKK